MKKKFLDHDYIEIFFPIHMVLIPMNNTGKFMGGLYLLYGQNMSNFVVNGRRLKNGIAHFIEHRIFDLKNSNAIDLFSKNLTSSNAETGLHHTFYYYGTDKEHAFDSLKILFEMFFHLYPHESQLEIEKNIIINEAKMDEDDPFYQIENQVKKTLYQSRSYGHDIVGELDDIINMTYEELIFAHDAFYTKENTTFIGVGAFDIDAFLAFINDFKYPSFISEMKRLKRIPIFKKSIIKEERKKIPYDIFYEEIAINLNDLKPFKKEMNLYIHFLVSLFESSYFIKLGKDQEVIDNDFGIDIEYDEMHFSLSFEGALLNHSPFAFIEEIFLHPEKYIFQKDYEAFIRSIHAYHIYGSHFPNLLFREIEFCLEMNYKPYDYLTKNSSFSLDNFFLWMKVIYQSKAHYRLIWRKK